MVAASLTLATFVPAGMLERLPLIRYYVCTVQEARGPWSA